jgi:hypothetical protein
MRCTQRDTAHTSRAPLGSSPLILSDRVRRSCHFELRTAMAMAPHEGVLALATRPPSGDQCISLGRPSASGAALRCHKAAPPCCCTLLRQQPIGAIPRSSGVRLRSPVHGAVCHTHALCCRRCHGGQAGPLFIRSQSPWSRSATGPRCPRDGTSVAQEHDHCLTGVEQGLYKPLGLCLSNTYIG